ncbi:MAG: hypothetical protein KAZ12_01260 [Paludibacteraceae bacterium]|nr:hypothetical protein [Paludibacteraceae bacterium]
MVKKDNTAWAFVGVLLILGALAVAFFFWQQTKKREMEMAEMVEMMTYEKEQLENEYNDLSLEMEGFSYKTNNDSILKLLDQEQTRVQLLLEELKTVKATNARRITELKKELASVRKVLIYYVSQVDSLNRINTKLVTENRSVTKKYQEATKTAEQLATEKQQLSKIVSIAAQLDARNIVVTTLNSRNRTTTRLSKISLIQFDFSIAKNTTAEIGQKTIFLRIMTPDDAVLQKRATDLFPFENQTIQYSCKKEMEYGGEELSTTLFWNVEEVLLAGTYRVDIFVDAHLIGTQTFKLEK